MKYFKLVNEEVTPAEDAEDWQTNLNQTAPIVDSWIGGIHVITVFTGVYRTLFESKNDLLFETIVFRTSDNAPKLPRFLKTSDIKYKTADEASKGHAELVQFIREYLGE